MDVCGEPEPGQGSSQWTEQLSMHTLEALKAEGAAQADLPRGESLAMIAERLDRWLNVQALPLWQAIGVDHAGGGFFETIDQDGRPVIGPRRMRVQPRQAFVFASAGEAGWAGPWRAAMDAGRGRPSCSTIPWKR